MFEMSETIGKLSAALAKAQGVMTGAAKDATNPHFRSKYATLEAVVEAIKAPLASNGIAYSQHIGGITDGSMEMVTIVSHAESGEWMRSTMLIPLGKRDAQGMGSAASYGRRYALMAVFGIPAEDDDGSAAVEPARPALVRSSPQRAEAAADSEAEQAVALMRQAKTADDLSNLWRTPWVMAIVKGGGEAAARITEAKDQRKAELTANLLASG